MNNWPESLALTFVPLFIVIDAIGNLPFVLALGESLSSREKRRMVHIAAATAAVIGTAFLFLGQFVLDIMGVSVGSFAIAGGLILLVLSIRYMTSGHMVEAVPQEMVAIVPIGTPLTAGPATITTLLLLANEFPVYIVLVSFLLNVLVTWVVFLAGGQIARFMGHGGLRAVSRVFSLLLAAIAVSMIIHGLDMLGIVSVNT